MTTSFTHQDHLIHVGRQGCRDRLTVGQDVPSVKQRAFVTFRP